MAMLLDTIKFALIAIRRNALRTVLTMLGIVIGVGAVIALVTIGRGTTAQITAEIGKLGSNLLQVRPGQSATGPGSGGLKSTARAFDMADVEAIRSQIGGITVASPVANKAVSAIAGNANWSTQVIGSDNGYLDALNWTLAAGREFLDTELRSGTGVCIIGESVRAKLFGNELDVVDRTVRLKNVSCVVVGILAPKGNSTFGQDEDDRIIIPLRTLQRRLAGNREVNQIVVSVGDSAQTDSVQREIERLMRERRRISPGAEDDFTVFDMRQVMSTISGVIGMLTGLLAAVAAVSLLVGGIGIMNIMLVSVTERTREIGIRLAIGAVQRQVLGQFLVEAIVLSLLGGLIGIAVGLGIALAVQRVLRFPLIIDVWTIGAAFAFCALIGVAFGFFPALRAARMDPIDALRRE